MSYNKLANAVLFIVSIATVSQSALIHHRDTLHILSTYGREVSVQGNIQFSVDSIPTDGNACSKSRSGIFFASLECYPVCPCCPTWSFSSSRPFYFLNKTQINWSIPLNLANFYKIDSSKSCLFCANPFYTIFIFSNTTIPNITTYVLVQVDTFYLDTRKPTRTGGGALGYPLETCKNMLVVDLYLQPDGSTDFSGAGIVPVIKNVGAARHTAALYSAFKYYDLQGRAISFARDGTRAHVPHGCYFRKSGNILEKNIMMNH
jgi:hypothetical protein